MGIEGCDENWDSNPTDAETVRENPTHCGGWDSKRLEKVTLNLSVLVLIIPERRSLIHPRAPVWPLPGLRLP